MGGATWCNPYVASPLASYLVAIATKYNYIDAGILLKLYTLKCLPVYVFFYKSFGASFS